jgi:hypothetical protein
MWKTSAACPPWPRDCALANCRQENAGRWCHAKRREVMFRNVIGVKAETIEEFDDFQSLLVKVVERQIVSVEMIEDAEIQLHSRTCLCECA